MYPERHAEWNRVDQVSRGIGLKICFDKTKAMKVQNKSMKKVNVRGAEIKYMQDFKYLGSYILTDIDRGLNQNSACSAGHQQTTEELEILQTKTKFKVCMSVVHSGLLYASEIWRTSQKIKDRLGGFKEHSLFRILRIQWKQRVTNEEVSRRRGANSVRPPPICESIRRWANHFQ